MNQQAKANEVTALSVIVHRAVNQDGPTAAPEKGFQSFSMVHTDTHTRAHTRTHTRRPSRQSGCRRLRAALGAAAGWLGVPG